MTDEEKESEKTMARGGQMQECKNCRALEKFLIVGRGYIANRMNYNCALGNKIIIKDEKPYSECKDKTIRVKRGK